MAILLLAAASVEYKLVIVQTTKKKFGIKKRYQTVEKCGVARASNQIHRLLRKSALHLCILAIE